MSNDSLNGRHVISSRQRQLEPAIDYKLCKINTITIRTDAADIEDLCYRYRSTQKLGSLTFISGISSEMSGPDPTSQVSPNTLFLCGTNTLFRLPLYNTVQNFGHLQILPADQSSRTRSVGTIPLHTILHYGKCRKQQL